MRETFGVGLSDLGGAVTWGEGRTLIESAAADPSTTLGAKLAGWGYPASWPQLLTLAAQIGDKKAVAKVMPWTLGAKQEASAEEIAAANAEFEDDIVFT